MAAKKYGKKGMAPYVSWVLMIGFAASLSVFLYAWITDEVTTSTSQIEKYADDSLCETTGINIDDVCQNTQTLNMNITNINLVEVNQLKFRFFDLYDNAETREINVTLRPQDTEAIEVLKQGTLRQAEIIPVIVGDNKVISCTKSMATLENIKIC